MVNQLGVAMDEVPLEMQRGVEGLLADAAGVDPGTRALRGGHEAVVSVRRGVQGAIRGGGGHGGPEVGVEEPAYPPCTVEGAVTRGGRGRG